MNFFFFLFSSILISSSFSSFVSEEFQSSEVKNLSAMAIALAEISRSISTTKTITILNVDNRNPTEFNEFIMEIYRLELETCIFNESKKFFNFIENNLKGSLEVTAFIFHDPNELINEVKFERNIFKQKMRNFYSTDSSKKSRTSTEFVHFLLVCKTFASKLQEMESSRSIACGVHHKSQAFLLSHLLQSRQVIEWWKTQIGQLVWRQRPHRPQWRAWKVRH